MGPRNKPRHSRKKKHSVKRQTKASSPPAMKRRLTKRKPVTDLGTLAVDVLREHRDGTTTALTDNGAELRGIVERLKRVESYTIIARMAVEGACDQVDEVAVLLQRAVGDLLFEQIRSLENIAAQCDGGLPSDRNDDTEGAE